MKLDNNINLYEVKTLLDGISYPLYNLATWKNGLPFKKINFSDSGIPVIKIAELNNGIGATTAYTNQIFSDDVHLKKGDLLFSWSGNPETSIDIFTFGLEEGWLNQHIFKVTPDESIIDRDYFYYLMKYLKPRFTKIAMNKQTTGLGHVTIADLKSLKIILPSLIVQKDIASRLKPLDEKIELNNKINQNLEQQAQLLYSTWFERLIPFDGAIPDDWNVGTLSDIAKINTNSFNPAKNPGVKLEHYSIPAFDEKRFPIFEMSENIKSNKYILSSNAVIASKLNPDTKRVWRPICLTDKAVCSTEFIVFEALEPRWRDFVYSIIDSSKFSDWMCAHTTGSTGSRQRTTPSTTLEFEIAIPSVKVIDEFCSLVTPVYDLIAENSKENYRLTMIRDALLPKLMSGEIDVSSVDI